MEIEAKKTGGFTTLPSGRVVALRELTVRDFIEARRQAGKGAGEEAVGMAVAARAILVDGRRPSFDEILEWPLRDIAAVARRVMPKEGDDGGEDAPLS